MNAFLFLVLTSSFVLLQSSPQASIQQPSPQTSNSSSSITQHNISWDTVLKIVVPIAIAWLSFVAQIIVLPFYKKVEELHKDYSASGKINSTIAAIETGELIPALARMYTLAADKQVDKRKRPEREMEELLQSVEFNPDLISAQEAMSAIDNINRQYKQLKLKASRLWKVGFSNVIVTLILLGIYLSIEPTKSYYFWTLFSFRAIWILTLAGSIFGFFSFHRVLYNFIELLEKNSTESA